MPFVNGTWVDDATGVPDQGMPPGMGDPTGAIVPAAQQTPMAPQQINPRPMLGGPQPAPAFTPSAVDVTGNPLQAPPVPLPAEDPRIRQQIQQGFQQLDRPSMTPGHLASTILSAPLTIPVGIIEELRGLMGGDTIQGWAQQARSRYNDPNFAESRAFGVQGPAEEPTFGDRFLGVVTGSAQRGAMAGKVIRQQIGAYNAERKAALRENKDVQQLQLGDINIQGGGIQNERNARKNEIERKYAELQAQLGIAGQQQGLMKGSQDMQAQNLQMILTKLRIGTAQEKADAQQQLTAILNSANPETRAAARGLTGGVAALTQNQYMPPSAVQTLQGIQGAGITNQSGVFRNLDAAATLRDPITGRTPAEEATFQLTQQNEALKQQLAQQKADQAQKAAKESLINQAVDDIMARYTAHIPTEADVAKEGTLGGLLAPYLGKGKSLATQREENLKLRDDVIRALKAGNLTQEQAGQISPGGKTLQDFLGADYDPAQGLVVRPSTIDPLAPSGGTGMDQVIGEPIRPPPMATPSATRTGGMSEDARRVNAEKLARFTPQFQAKWQAQHPDKPMRGPLYESEFKRNAEANGLVVESLQ
jgi:hypothetical protein